MNIRLTLLLLFSVIAAYGQQANPTNIPFLEEQIAVDGKLNDAVWDKIAPFTGFHNTYPSDEGLATNQTEVKIFHNRKFLFIGVVYHDSDAKNVVGSLKRDVYYESVFLSDGFGVILDPFEEKDNGYFFAMNASGVQFDALIGNINEINESWSALWKGQTHQQGTEKYYEMAIPLYALNFNPQKATWGIQFYINDNKANQFSNLAPTPRNFLQYDLRFTEQVRMDSLPDKVLRKFSIIPSVAVNYTYDKLTDTKTGKFIPSLDGQYNISSSIRLDLTVNPDFSQVEVDQQVTNLTRFAINFPERRKFFLENSDLFNNLGHFYSNPFYSRRIGSLTDILFGAKLSGNVGTKTRIGLLNAQTKNKGQVKGQNYTVAVARQNLSKALIGTLFFVNGQQKNAFNRIVGSNLNFKSKNTRWQSVVNYAQAFTTNLKGKSGFLNAEVGYETRKLNWSAGYQRAGKNYVAETGFVPLLYNYDPITETTIRQSYYRTRVDIQLRHYAKETAAVNWIRRFWIENESTFNVDNTLRENFVFFSPFAIRYKNSSYIYVAFGNTDENLSYNFDFLQNGNFITPGHYNYTFGRTGYWSPNNKKFYFGCKFEIGQFYNGLRINPYAEVSYRLLPTAVLSGSYSMNAVDLKSLGSKTFHLAKLTAEIYLNNRINWTTYLQYGTQQNNFNINSRFQWEYKPLSYVYLVFSNNYDNELASKNWGVSFKINRRLDF